MSWNHRVMKIGDVYGIHEVHYKKGKPSSYTVNSMKPEAFVEDEDSRPLQDLRWTLEQMLKALDKPILTPKDF